MSMTLKRIELWNIRVHKHMKFIPDESGITSVSGANGAGKSTIVDAFAWALYGTKTNNIKNKMLIREGVSPKKEEVKVEVEIRVNKIDYLIKRTIVGEGGGADCNVYGRSADNADGEFNHLAGPAISSAEAFIKQILKMDEKGFLTAVLIQQKQVDQIVAASPRERGEVIEKLTGIQSITNAINLAREEARAAQKAAGVITLQDTDTLAATIKENIAEGKELKERTETASKQIEEMTAELEEKDVAYEASVSMNKKASELHQTLKLNKERKKMFDEEMNTLMEVVSSHKKETKTTVTEDLETLEAKVTKARKVISKLDVEKSSLTKKNASATSRISKIKESLTLSPDELNSLLSVSHNKAEELKAVIQENTEAQQNQKGEEKQVKKSLATLGNGLTCCPVCKSKIEDPAELQAEIESELKEIKAKAKAHGTKAKAASKELAEVEAELAKLTTMEELYTELSSLNTLIEDNDSRLDELEEELADTTSKLTVLDKHYKEALVVASRADEVRRAKLRIKKVNAKLGSIKEKDAEIKKELENMAYPTDKELRSLYKDLETFRKSLNKKIIENNKDTEQLKFLRVRVTDLKREYKSASEAKAKYTQLTTSMKNASVAGSLMSEFKENRIKYAIPALEMYASTILSKFTDGKFIKLELDSKFNTFVTTDTGAVRPIAQLSGGELSAAAIALRIGISMLLNDGENNVLILDEILVSMDDTRARHIIETITSITNCQVIFIAHNSDIQNIADKTFQI